MRPLHLSAPPNLLPPPPSLILKPDSNEGPCSTQTTTPCSCQAHSTLNFNDRRYFFCSWLILSVRLLIMEDPPTLILTKCPLYDHNGDVFVTSFDGTPNPFIFSLGLIYLYYPTFLLLIHRPCSIVVCLSSNLLLPL